MIRRVAFVVAAALICFWAGYGVRVWIERHGPLPHPPISFLGEFRQGRADFRSGRPINRAELIARIEALRPQLDAFRTKRDEIDAQFEAKFDAVLTPEQRAKHAEIIARRHRSNSDSENQPISEDRLEFLLREQPGMTVIGDVVIPVRLDRLTGEYKLDDAQREQVRALLRERRDAFIALVDSSPPASISLIRLAPLVQRLAMPNPPATPGPPQ